MATFGHRYLALVYLLVIILAVKVSSKPSPNVQAPSARFIGVNEAGNLGDPYEAFYGIPFAQPPIGDLRFAVSLLYIQIFNV